MEENINNENLELENQETENNEENKTYTQEEVLALI